ncbi:MAG: hypothetical protein LBD53_08510 [Tannerella sp.]|nr:hypothetical protein [Tannerella sp.]
MLTNVILGLQTTFSKLSTIDNAVYQAFMKNGIMPETLKLDWDRLFGWGKKGKLG